MTQHANSRRNFIKLAATGAAGSALSWDAASYARIPGANGRLGIGIVGFSERGQDALFPALQQLSGEQNCDIVAVSDIWKLHREEGAAWLGKQANKSIAQARNNDELYAMKNVDAVIISTADHQHALHGIEAVKAGRDAYVEKPLANHLEDARAILKAVKESNRIVQIGTQRRSSASVLRAKEFLQSGEFGALNQVEFTYNANQPTRWRRPKLVEALRQEDTDWKRFVMGRTKDAFDPHKYVEFRLYWPYSSGIPDQWMVHQIDALHFITGLPHPRSVVANGGIYQWRDGRNNPDAVTAVFDYGPLKDLKQGFQVVFTGHLSNSARGQSDIYYSINGTFDANSGKITREGGLSDRYAKGEWKGTTLRERTLGTQAKSNDAPDVRAGVDNAVVAHMRNWLECVRSRKSPVADVQAGYNHSVALCMTLSALHSGKRATFDEMKQEVTI
ncbi:MAG: Gfo/Idh/MocA family oxidoreductase [Acidobacteriota bacterium]|nr:Gfo/Idh/MocA family oxidoreductase [Acidobacteriota bacterium]